MEKSRPQLSLAELFQLRWFLGGLLGLLSAWTLFYMEVDALLALALLTLLVPIFTFWPALSLALPTFVHRLAFPLIVTIFALDFWANREPLPAMIRLSLMLLGYRCIAPRSRREDLQLILLALFVVVITGVFTVSPAFVVQILFFTGVALALLLTVTLSDARAGGVAAIDAAPGWQRVRWLELLARVRAAADGRVVLLGGGLFCGVVGLSTVLFLALPRVEISNDFFLDRLITKSSRTGFSENIRFNEVTDIAQDGGAAFAVDVSDLAAVPADPYWRMLVLDEYTGDGFRMSRGLRASLLPIAEKRQSFTGTGRSRADNTSWTIYYQPGVSRYLPFLGSYGGLSFGEPQGLAQSQALRLAALQAEPAKMIAFRIEGMDTHGVLRDPLFALEREVQAKAEWERKELGSDLPETVASAAPSTPDEAILPSGDELALQPPPPPPTFLELGALSAEERALLTEWVVEIGGVGEGGGDFARRASAWLQASHRYSLSSVTPPGEGDVLIRWMASTESGHCELFAGGLVLLARAAGVPARLLTGFRGGVWNETSGHISVKNSDAHAWTEVWEESMNAWVRVDATPGSEVTADFTPQSQSPSGASSLERDSGWSARIDSLRIFWYRRIVNFDQDSQIELLRDTKTSLRIVLEAAQEELERIARELLDWLRQPWDFGRIAGIALFIGVTAGAIAWWRATGRALLMGWRSRRASSHREDPVRREASRWLVRVARVEVRDGELGRTGSAAGQAARESLAVARADLLRLRFGAREGWHSPADVFGRARRACRLVRSIARDRR